MDNKDIEFYSEDRVLFIIHDKVIRGATRFQKYGFLLYQQYDLELAELKINWPSFNFYNDWMPHHYGPYSKELAADMKASIENKIIGHAVINDITHFSLTIRGRDRWRKFFVRAEQDMKKIIEKVEYLQGVSLRGLLKQIYGNYPKFAVNSKIKE